MFRSVSAPDPVGGTEVFVANLQELGVDAMVPPPSETSRAYTIDSQWVRRFASSNGITDVADLCGERRYSGCGRDHRP